MFSNAVSSAARFFQVRLGDMRFSALENSTLLRICVFQVRCKSVNSAPSGLILLIIAYWHVQLWWNLVKNHVCMLLHDFKCSLSYIIYKHGGHNRSVREIYYTVILYMSIQTIASALMLQHQGLLKWLTGDVGLVKYKPLHPFWCALMLHRQVY